MHNHEKKYELIKFEDGGRVFFIQKRVTKDCKVFNIIKFRSMIDEDSEKVILYNNYQF